MSPTGIGPRASCRPELRHRRERTLPESCTQRLILRKELPSLGELVRRKLQWQCGDQLFHLRRRRRRLCPVALLQQHHDALETRAKLLGRRKRHAYLATTSALCASAAASTNASAMGENTRSASYTCCAENFAPAIPSRHATNA